MKKRLFAVLLIAAVFAFSFFFLTPPKTIEGRASAFLGRPYLSHPLGEACGYDKKPLYRFDGFDCTTYVETVLANPFKYGFVKRMNRIRYLTGTVDFKKRTHFMEHTWIPNASCGGFLSGVSLPVHRTGKIDVDLGKFYTDYFKGKYTFPEEAFGQEFFYMPVKDIKAETLKNMPDNMVVFFVRCNMTLPSAKGDMVTHMGLLFDRTRLYHASSKAGKVVQVSFMDYLKENKGYCGVMFYEINQ